MSDAGENVAARLWLATRRYALVVLTSVVALTAAAVFSAREEDARPRYEATAVVVATDLKIRIEGLPKFAEAVFSGGSVAENAARSLPFDPVTLMREKAEMEPFENSVVFELRGLDDDPVTAARIANEVAEAFVDELNKAGPTLGTFAVQDSARPPPEPVDEPSLLVPVALGLIGGAALGLGVVVLLLLVRRPVLLPSDAEAAASAGLVADLVVPRRGLPDATMQPPPGTAALARVLFPDRAGLAALVSAGDPAARSRVAVLVSLLLARSGPVQMVTSKADEVARAVAATGVVVIDEVPGREVWSVGPVVIDGPSEYDLPVLHPPNARLVLVVRSGTRQSQVEAAAREFLPGDLTGVVFVRRGRLRRLLPRAGRAARARQSRRAREAPRRAETTVGSS